MIVSDHDYLIGVEPGTFEEKKAFLQQFKINLVEHVVLEFEGNEYFIMMPFEHLQFYNCFGEYNHVYNMDFFISEKSSEEWKKDIYRIRDMMIAEVNFWRNVMVACVEKFGVFKIIPDYCEGDEINISQKEIKFDEWTDLDFLKMGEERILVVTRE